MLVNRCDTHTHTLFSRHAYSTIAENVSAAKSAGLELLGTTEHFSDMLFDEQSVRNFQYFLNLHSWPHAWDGVQILHGCEADIVSLDGDLFGHDIHVPGGITSHETTSRHTLSELVFRDCDYVIASVHGKDFAEGASLAQATGMYIGALENPRVLMLGHTGRSGVPFDVDAVVGAARDAHKLIEINEHSLADTPASREPCRRIAERCAELGCAIAINSDAHICCDVGRFTNALAMLDEIGFPPELVATRSAEAFLAAIAAAGVSSAFGSD